MNILKKFKENVIGTVGKDQSHSGRYINPDGTPYGSSGAMRFLLSPGFSTGAAVPSVILSPLFFVVSNPEQLLVSVATLAGMSGSMLAGINLGIFKAMRTGKGAIIDTFGKDGSKANANHEVQRALAKAMIGNIGLCFVSGFASPLFPLCFGAQVISYGKTRSKLFRGDWTVLDTPPKKRERKLRMEKAKAPKFTPAFG